MENRKSPARKVILSAEEKIRCLALVDLRAGLDSQRAAALIALDQGVTQGVAAGQSGLTLGQVRYLLQIFLRDRMEVFNPASAVQSAEQQDTEPTLISSAKPSELVAEEEKPAKPADIKEKRPGKEGGKKSQKDAGTVKKDKEKKGKEKKGKDQKDKGKKGKGKKKNKGKGKKGK
ncbi:MAG: hypothetical protein R2940_10025 [Syntrophotaleaceae bacterium]